MVSNLGEPGRKSDMGVDVLAIAAGTNIIGKVEQGWTFGQPTLFSQGNGVASWARATRTSTLPTDQKSTTGWLARLYGGVQDAYNDAASLYIPVNEMPLPDLGTTNGETQWTYWKVATEAFGCQIQIWIHDPTDNSKRADIIQSGAATLLTKASGWNVHLLNKTTASQFFYQAENEGSPGLTEGSSYLYSLAQFQADTVFKNWTIYRISLNSGYYTGGGTFVDTFVADVKINGEVIPLEPPTPVVTKTIETELQAIVAVAADVQDVSSVLDLGNIKQVTLLIDHAKDHASASVGQGTEYVIQVSEKASGNDTWRSLAAFTAAITVPIAFVSDGEEVAGQTVIECSAAVPAVGDILFWKNSTIANSEWSNIIAVDASGGTESATLESGLTNTQAGGTYYTQGEHFVLTVNVRSVTRLRVVCNNTKGTTNRAVVWRVAAITEK